MKFKESVLFIFFLYSNFSFAQIAPDSLIGTYVGTYWYKWDDDTIWTISQDTAFILSVDTNECFMHHVFPAGLPSGNGQFETMYDFCTQISDNWFSRFYSNDSLFVKFDEVSQPPPNIKIWSARFFGKKVSSKILSIPIEPLPNIAVYPNPFVQSFRLKFNQKGLYDIKLFNNKGSIVYGKKISNGFGEYTVYTSNLAQGVYFLQIVYEDQIIHYKLIKQ